MIVLSSIAAEFASSFEVAVVMAIPFVIGMGLFRRANKKERRRAFEIARENWVKCRGWESDECCKQARVSARAQVKQEYGSIVLYITVAAAIVQIIYTLYRFWKETRCENPDLSLENRKICELPVTD